MSYETKTVSVRDGLFQVEMRRGGKGDPLVYLHGAGGQDAWDPFFDLLAERYTVYQPFSPGWRGSTGLDHLDDVHDMALFYLDLFDALGLASVNLVGHSLGGMFAAEIAAMDAAYVRKLVLCAPAGLWLDEAPVPDFYAMTQDELMAALYCVPPAIAPQDPAKATPEQRQAMARAAIEQAKALAASTKFLWPIWDKGLKKRLHRIKAPTLIVWGDSDGLNPPVYGPEFEKLIPGSRLVVIPGTAHLPMAERPEEFVRVVREFLEAP